MEAVKTGYAWINRGPGTGIRRESLSARAIWIMTLAICTMLFVGLYEPVALRDPQDAEIG